MLSKIRAKNERDLQTHRRTNADATKRISSCYSSTHTSGGNQKSRGNLPSLSLSSIHFSPSPPLSSPSLPLPPLP